MGGILLCFEALAIDKELVVDAMVRRFWVISKDDNRLVFLARVFRSGFP